MDGFSERFEGSPAKRSLGFLVRRAHRLISQQGEQAFEGRDLTLTQWVVLKLIGDGATVTSGEAARMLEADTGGPLPRLIDHLESQGLVERKRETGDRRLVSLVLTPAGTRMAKACAGEMARVSEELLAEFTPFEVETLIDLMSRLVERLESRDTS